MIYIDEFKCLVKQLDINKKSNDIMTDTNLFEQYIDFAVNQKI